VDANYYDVILMMSYMGEPMTTTTHSSTPTTPQTPRGAGGAAFYAALSRYALFRVGRRRDHVGFSAAGTMSGPCRPRRPRGPRVPHDERVIRHVRGIRRAVQIRTRGHVGLKSLPQPSETSISNPRREEATVPHQSRSTTWALVEPYSNIASSSDIFIASSSSSCFEKVGAWRRLLRHWSPHCLPSCVSQ